MNIYEDLERRDLIAQLTNEEDIRKKLDDGKSHILLSASTPRPTACTSGTCFSC